MTREWNNKGRNRRKETVEQEDPATEDAVINRPWRMRTRMNYMKGMRRKKNRCKIQEVDIMKKKKMWERRETHTQEQTYGRSGRG